MPSIRKGLAIAFLVSILLPLAVLAAAIYVGVSGNVNAAMARKNQALARAALVHIDHAVREAAFLLKAAADAAIARQPEGAATLLADILLGHGGFEEAEILDAAGRLIAHVPRGESMRGFDYSMRDPAESGISFSDAFISPTSAKPTVALRVPLASGSAYGNLDLAWLEALSSSLSFGDGGCVLIAGRRGTVIAHPDPGLVARRTNIADLVEGPFAKAYEGERELRIGGRDFMTTSLLHGPTGWTIIVAEPLAEAHAARSIVASIALVGCVLAMVLAGAAAWVTGRGFMRSFEVLGREVQEIERGSYRSITFEPRYAEIKRFVASFNRMARAVSEREDSLKEARSSLERALRDKEILLKEVHHRVKNNMQVIASLLNLQRGYVVDPRDEALIEESQLRIETMALVHEKLYQSSDAESVDLKEYLESLAGTLASFNADRGIRVRVDGSGASVDLVKAVPASLAAFEAISNSFKHAFPGRREGSIQVRVDSSEEGMILLEVSDDGEGFPAGFDPRKASSLGWQLIAGLVDQLGGELEWGRSPRGGAFTRIHFPAGS
jgi:two-component sensor histidine kinase/type II secretory pathway pseudopilin PulG